MRGTLRSSGLASRGKVRCISQSHVRSCGNIAFRATVTSWPSMLPDARDQGRLIVSAEGQAAMVPSGKTCRSGFEGKGIGWFSVSPSRLSRHHPVGSLPLTRRITWPNRCARGRCNVRRTRAENGSIWAGKPGFTISCNRVLSGEYAPSSPKKSSTARSVAPGRAPISSSTDPDLGVREKRTPAPIYAQVIVRSPRSTSPRCPRPGSTR